MSKKWDECIPAEKLRTIIGVRGCLESVPEDQGPPAALEARISHDPRLHKRGVYLNGAFNWAIIRDDYDSLVLVAYRK